MSSDFQGMLSAHELPRKELQMLVEKHEDRGPNIPTVVEFPSLKEVSQVPTLHAFWRERYFPSGGAEMGYNGQLPAP